MTDEAPWLKRLREHIANGDIPSFSCYPPTVTVTTTAVKRERRPRKPTLASVARQVNKAELAVARYEMRPDGTVVVVTGQPTPNDTEINPWDTVLRHHAADQKRPS